MPAAAVRLEDSKDYVLIRFTAVSTRLSTIPTSTLTTNDLDIDSGTRHLPVDLEVDSGSASTLIERTLIAEKGAESETIRAWLRENAQNWSIYPLFRPGETSTT